MFYSIRKLLKNLEEWNKVHNFAPANETEVLPMRLPRWCNASGGAKVEGFEKKLLKILVIQKLVVTLQNLSEIKKTEAWPTVMIEH